MPLPSLPSLHMPSSDGSTRSTTSVGTRAGLIGKVLLWVIGIPLLIMVFAIAAIGRGLFGTHGARPAGPGDDGTSPSSTHQQGPLHDDQPRGPDRAGRARRGVDL